ncbi:zinc-ribbon domain-containing protein [Ruminococcus sp.]|uniref:zinc-ribbon domain-containing protein n=1 Tax=Ruminococcus sp. TaxID=41978 RepID=UPI00338FB83A
MAFCSKCGKQIDDEAVMCVHCGCPVTSQSSQEAKAETQGLSDKQKKSHLLWLWLFWLDYLQLFGFLSNRMIPQAVKKNCKNTSKKK